MRISKLWNMTLTVDFIAVAQELKWIESEGTKS